ncbi:hypothetical protein SFA35_19655 [Pseudomonas sp. HR96]|uniref:hypothetical protein n=1 Tax=Pseudomonas sp. HR96 TaxID=1027966 RepID=UPI002A749432|nr:hypothetical protein [Pseudomonas sp. HR96]WPO98816.1 hypothetical protein SFA35_19655 [Pseudomonas sp. HR96]
MPTPHPLAPSRRRPLDLQFNGAKLVLCIALGVWLGVSAVAGTAWYAYKTLYGTPPSVPVASGKVIRPEPPINYQPQGDTPDSAAATPEPDLPAAPPAGNDSGAMFDQYQRNLHNQQLAQAEQEARSNPRNQSNAKCQFWLQQAQTAPSQKARENIAQFCE